MSGGACQTTGWPFDLGLDLPALALGAVAVRALERLRGFVLGHRLVREQDLAPLGRVVGEVVGRLLLTRGLVQPVERQRDRDDRGEQQRPALDALEPAALEVFVGEERREVRGLDRRRARASGESTAQIR